MFFCGNRDVGPRRRQACTAARAAAALPGRRRAHPHPQLCGTRKPQTPTPCLQHRLTALLSLDQVINQVGAFNLKATLNCEAFATEHSSTAHFDVKSFVGLAWRPAGEPICCGEFPCIHSLSPHHTHRMLSVCVRRNLRHGAGKVSPASTLLFYIVRIADTSF